MALWQYLCYQDAQRNMGKTDIIVVVDFAENYSCLVPKEVQSMHWCQVQASLFIGVVIRHANATLDGIKSTKDSPILVEEEYITVLDDLYMT